MFKLHWLIPVAFFADVHGFNLFAPYVGMVLTVAYVARRLSRNRPVPVRAE
jgi:hypothetical protein